MARLVKVVDGAGGAGLQQAVVPGGRGAAVVVGVPLAVPAVRVVVQVVRASGFHRLEARLDVGRHLGWRRDEIIEGGIIPTPMNKSHFSHAMLCAIEK